MPIDGWDHLEIWVGNAKQSAYFYETPTASRARPTRARRRASATAPRTCSSRARSASSHERPARRQRDLQVGGDEGRQRARRRARRPRCDERVPPGRPARRSRRRRAALGRGRPRPCRARRDRDLRRQHPHLRQPLRVLGAVPARVRLGLAERRPGARSRPHRDRPRRRQRRARPHGRVGRLLRARARLHAAHALLGRGHLDRVLRAHVEGDDGRRGEDQVPDQRAGRGKGRARSRSTSSSTAARACSTSRCSRRTS